jgi:NADH-quinone oxidoreductase subunit J
MSFILNIYFLLSLGLIISSSFVVFSSNPIYSLLWLVLTFLFSTSLLLLIGSEFLALIFIVVYIGAIAVLFLFAIMLLDFKIKNLAAKKNKSFTSVFFFNLFFLIFLILLNQVQSIHIFSNFTINWTSFVFFILFFTDNTYLVFFNWSDILNSLNDIETYSLLIYDVFVLQLLLVGFILLVVLIGVVFLTNSYQSIKILDQSIFKQVSVNSNFFYK